MQTLEPASRRNREPGARGWLRTALPVVLGVLLVSMIAHFRVPLLPDIGRDLAMSPAQLGLVATVFALGRLALDLPVGRLADRHDPIRLMGTAAGIMGVGSLGLALAPSAVWVLAASAVLGGASALGNTTGMTALSGAASPERRGSAMALYSGSLLGGQALGPMVAGGVAALGTWRTAGFAGAGAGAGVFAAALLWHRRRTTRSLPTMPQRPAAPPGDPLTGTQRAVLYLVGFSVFFTIGAMPQTIVPLVGAGEFGLRAAQIGVALGLGGAARMVGAGLAGLISDRVSRRRALIPGLVVQALGVALLGAAAAPGWWVAAIVLMSLGSSGTAVGATMLGDRTEPQSLGATLGRYRFAGDMGLVAGPVLVAGVYQHSGRVAAAAVVVTLLGACAAAAVLLPETYRGGRNGS